MASQWTDVRTFGGGLNFSVHPAGLRDDEWTYSLGFRANLGTAEHMLGYDQVQDASWIPATYTPMGIVEDLVGSTNGVLIPLRKSLTDAKLYQIEYITSAATEVTLSGTSPRAASTTTSNRPSTIMERTICNGTQVFPLSSTNNGLATYDGTNFAVITPSSGTIGGNSLVSYNNRLVSLTGTNTIGIADQSSLTEWTPAVSNSADTITLDDPGELQCIVGVPDGVIALGSERIYMLRPTGGIPPFSVSTISTIWNGITRGTYGMTPVGLLYSGPDGLRVLGAGMWEPSLKVARALRTIGAKIVYDPQWNEIIVRQGNTDLWRCELATGAWSYAAMASTIRDHCSVVRSGVTRSHWVLRADGYVFSSEGSSAYASARVDTKDFSLPDGATAGYIDRIRVSWEPLSNASTDAVQVYAWGRQDYWPAASTGAASLGYGAGAGDFTSVGTVTGGGVTELPCRIRGRYVRWSFRPTSGRVRIRGFSFRWKPASDRKGAA